MEFLPKTLMDECPVIGTFRIPVGYLLASDQGDDMENDDMEDDDSENSISDNYDDNYEDEDDDDEMMMK